MIILGKINTFYSVKFGHDNWHWVSPLGLHITGIFFDPEWSLSLCCCFFFLASYHVACGIFVPWPGIEPGWTFGSENKVLTSGLPGNFPRWPFYCDRKWGVTQVSPQAQFQLPNSPSFLSCKAPVKERPDLGHFSSQNMRTKIGNTLQGYIAQYRKYSQYFLITINGI